MTAKPSYVVHHVDEKDVTIDWFFGEGHLRVKIVQGILIVLGWFFAILPVVITASALLHRDDGEGWWNYSEGFDMWDRTVLYLSLLAVVFVVGFLVLDYAGHRVARKHATDLAYDAERLAARLEIAADWYADKYGPEAERRRQRRIRIEPYSDLETYELRGLYRTYEVD